MTNQQPVSSDVQDPLARLSGFVDFYNRLNFSNLETLLRHAAADFTG